MQGVARGTKRGHHRYRGQVLERKKTREKEGARERERELGSKRPPVEESRA